MAGTPLHKWTDEETIGLIRLRSENNHLFMGKRQTNSKAWEEIVQQMGLQDQVSPAEVAKKWAYLKQRYKQLKFSATGTERDGGEAPGATWPFLTAMNEAFGWGESMDPLVLMDSTNMTYEASDASSASHGSMEAICSQESEEEEEEQDDARPCNHSWTLAETRKVIQLRSENDHLFTGKKNTARKAWRGILEQMGLQELVRPAQIGKKWDNMKRKYKSLRSSAAEAGTGGGETAAASWRWFSAMHEAIGGGRSDHPPPPTGSCAAENPEGAGDDDLDASGSSPGSVTAPRSAVCVETEGEEVEEEIASDDDAAQPGSLSPTQEDSEPGTSACPPPPKRRRCCQAAVLEFLKEEAVREEERFRAALEHTNRFLDLFEQLVNKLARARKAASGEGSVVELAALENFKSELAATSSDQRLFSSFPSLCQDYVRKSLMEEQMSSGITPTPGSTTPAANPSTKDNMPPGKRVQQHRRPEEMRPREENPYLKAWLRHNYGSLHKPKRGEKSSHLSANGTLNIPSVHEITLHPTRLHEDYCTPKSVHWAKGVWKKANRESQLPKSSIKVTGKWEWLSVDVKGPLPETPKGHRFLLVVMDLYSKWVEACPMKSSCAREVALNIRNLVCQLGLPHALFSQLGRVFIKAVNKALSIYMAMEDCSLVVFHPKTCSLDPTTYANVNCMVAKLVRGHQEKWDTHLRTCLFALRAKKHPSTGQSPFYALYHRDPQKDPSAKAPQPVGLSDDHPISRILASPPLTDTQVPWPSRMPASLPAQMGTNVVVIGGPGFVLGEVWRPCVLVHNLQGGNTERNAP